MTLIIKKCTVSELEQTSTFGTLLAAYAEESNINGLPSPRAKMEMYRLMEKSGSLQPIGAFIDDTLIGLAVVLTVMLPHYSEIASTIESIFVERSHRRSGAGLKLLHIAEECAQERGAKGILVSAPLNGSLAAVLERRSEYSETNRVFFKRFS